MRKQSKKGLTVKLLALAAVGGSVMTSGCYIGIPLYGPGFGIHVYPYVQPYRGRDGRYYYRHRHPEGYYYWSPSPKPQHKPQHKPQPRLKPRPRPKHKDKKPTKESPKGPKRNRNK